MNFDSTARFFPSTTSVYCATHGYFAGSASCPLCAEAQTRDVTAMRLDLQAKTIDALHGRIESLSRQIARLTEQLALLRAGRS
jgi:hypothetical protein